jgi:hypothetical protein
MINQVLKLNKFWKIFLLHMHALEKADKKLASKESTNNNSPSDRAI